MITLDFLCSACNIRKEYLLRNHKEIPNCPKCRLPMQKMFAAPAVLNTTRGKDIVDVGLGKTFSTCGERSKYLKQHGYEDGHRNAPKQKRVEPPEPTREETENLVNLMKQHGEL